MTARRRWLVGIVAVAVALRIWAVLHLPPEEQLPVNDARGFDTMAMSLLAGRGLSYPEGGSEAFYPLPPGPTSEFAPVFPAFLAAVYTVFGHEYAAARIVLSIVESLTCAFLYGIGACWGAPVVGLLAAAIAAVYPPFIHFSYYGGPGFLLSEGMFMVLLAAGVWCLARLAVRIRHWPTAAAAGVALGLATLTRPVTLLFPGVLAVWAWCAPRGERRDWAKAMAVVCAAMALTILPWTIRNARVHGRLVLVTSGAGQAFWVGNNLLARGGYVPRPQLFDPQTFDPGFTMTEAERFQKMAQQGFAFWREHPEKLPKLFLRKFLMLWNVYDVRYNLAYGLLLPWAALGLYAARRPAAPQIGRLLVGLLLYVSLISVIVIGSTRYRYPFEPYVILFAAAGLVWWFRRPAPRWVPATALAGIVGVNLAWYRCSDQVLAWLRGAFQAAGLR